MSPYLQSLTSHLHDRSLLTDELKAALLEHDDAFKPSYIDWLWKQSFAKDKFTDI